MLLLLWFSLKGLLMFELYSTGMKTQQLEEDDEKLFICHIHSYREYNQQWNVCSAFNPSKSTHTWSSGHTHTHKPGAVDTYTPGAVDTHLEQRTHTHTHTHTHTGAVGTHTPHTHHTEQWAHTHLEQWAHTTHTHTHTHLEQWAHTHTHLEQWKHTHTWSSERCGARGGSWGFGALLKGLTSVVDNSCRSREPITSDYKSSALSIRPRLHLDYNLQLYCVTSHTVWLSEK